MKKAITCALSFFLLLSLMFSIFPASVSYADNSIKGRTYTFQHDQWSIYKATAIKDDVFKIEKWGRFYADDDVPFEFISDFLTFKTKDNAYDFKWLNEDKNVFSLTIKDPDNPYFTGVISALFKENNDYNTDLTAFEYQNDRWNYYKAYAINTDVINIEHWGRFDADDDFEYYGDYGIINIRNNEFTWTGNSYLAFTTTMKDENNANWESSKNVSFCRIKDQLSSYYTYYYENDNWNTYKAYWFDTNLIKIETWSRFSSDDPLEMYYDLLTIDITSSDTDFDWVDDQHSSFTVTLEDPENYYFEGKKLTVFTYRNE